MVAIIDDRQDVWPNAQNLIVVPPFEYFRPSKCDADGKRRQDDVADCVSSLLNKVDRPCYLPRLRDVLIELHRRFYEKDNSSVHEILSQMKSEILDGLAVKLSPSLAGRWDVARLVERIGGRVVDGESGDVSIGTEQGSVGVQWLFDCAFYWKQPDKEAYRNYFVCDGEALLR